MGVVLLLQVCTTHNYTYGSLSLENLPMPMKRSLMAKYTKKYHQYQLSSEDHHSATINITVYKCMCFCLKVIMGVAVQIVYAGRGWETIALQPFG